MSGVLIGFGIIGFVILVGFLVGRFGIAGPSAQYVMNRLAFFVATPALLFTVLARADLHVVFSAFLLGAALSVTVTVALYVLASRLLFRRPLPETTVGAAASCYVNANNIGLPVAIYVLGDPQFVAPVLLLQLLVLAPITLTTLDTATRGKASVTGFLTQPLRNPMIIASLLGVLVALTGVQLPDAVFQPFELIGGAAIPLVLMAFGLSLHGQRPLEAGSGRKDVLTAVGLKSVVMPAIAYLFAHVVFRLDSEQVFAATVLAALPTAQNVYNFAARYERGMVIARDAVLLSTVASVPVLVVIAALLAPR